MSKRRDQEQIVKELVAQATVGTAALKVVDIVRKSIAEASKANELDPSALTALVVKILHVPRERKAPAKTKATK